MNIETLVFALHNQGLLTDARLADAFRSVPRHLFLPAASTEVAYKDAALYDRTDSLGGFIGGSDQPSQMAKMLGIAQLEEGLNVLEIGTGTGYNAALIQHVLGKNGHITSIEIDKETSERAQDNLRRAQMSSVKVVHADAAGGYAPRASYDRIISTVALWDIPPAWLRQLKPGGLLVAPIYIDGLQVCSAFRIMADGSLYSEQNHTCSFVTIGGLQAPPRQYVYLGGGSALRIYSNDASKIDSARLHLMMLSDADRCHLGRTPTAIEYWDGFVPYMMLNVAPNYDFVCYTVEGGKIVYGLSGHGFGVITLGSATFVNTSELGDTHCFAGVDAFLEVNRVFEAWERADKPRVSALRLQLTPMSQAPESVSVGRLYTRNDHMLHAWLDESPA